MFILTYTVLLRVLAICKENMQRRLRLQNNLTIERLNQITNNKIVRLAEEACILSNVSNQVAEVHDEGDTESGIDITLRQATDLASDLIGKLNVVDLFSVTAIKILAAETGTEKFTAIIEATKSLSEYTHSFGNALYETPRNDFDLITHSILQIART